jgi:beta-glucosidase
MHEEGEGFMKTIQCFIAGCVVTAGLILFAGGVRAQATQPDYRNPALPVEKRVADLLGRMTLEEKLAQLRNVQQPRVATLPKEGVGGITGVPSGRTAAGGLENMVAGSNAVQKQIIDNSRLGIPVIIHDEALHGLNKMGATSFPQAIALAATWDLGVMDGVASAIAREAKATGCRQVLSPVVNIGNDPRWGRTQETYGEDPYLSARMGATFCKAFTREGIVTTPKHFVANFGDGGRDSNPIDLDERILREVYFPPFEACIKEGGALSLMPAFNSVNGRPCNANHWLLTDILRNEWGFKGFTVCDYDAIHEIMEFHRTAANLKEAAAQALNAGLDVELPGINAFGQPLEDAVKEGLVPLTVVNDAVGRRLAVKFQLGLFENPYAPDIEEGKKLFATPENLAVSLQAARESIVLLRNEGNLLPLKKDLKTIAVIGARANVAQLGNYSRPGSGKVSILQGITNAVSPATQVLSEHGTDFVEYRLPIIPAEYFTHLEDGKPVGGLKAEYFNNMELKGDPGFVRTEQNLNFNAGGSPNAAIGADFFSARWTGRLRSPVTGKLKLSLTTGDGVRFWFNGQKLLESWEDRFSTTDYFTVHLVAGQEYDIKVEFFEDKWGATALLGWDYGFEAAEDAKIQQAVAAVKKADAAVVVTSILEGEFIDRANLDLPGYQEKLINAVTATGVPTVVVLVGGSAITMGNWIDDVPAVVDAWYGGDAGGTAVAEVLFGDYNPAGRLPIGFPRSSAELPMPYNHKPTGRGYDYAFMAAVPLYPFGYGLSYTKFTYGDITLSRPTIGPADSVVVSLPVKNDGSRAGDEVVQLYVRDMVGSVSRPVKELKGFSRISLKPGESRTVRFTLGPKELRMLNEKMQWVVEPGEFSVMVGASSEDIRSRASLWVK